MKALIAVLMLCIVGCSAGNGRYAVRPWEHGWKTEYVVSTRYANPQMGYNIGFKYPRNPNDCDRKELSDFMEQRGGFVYEGGGYPGAEMFVIFKDVRDRESADRKLQQILPPLSRVVASF